MFIVLKWLNDSSQAMADVTGEEFRTFMTILSSLKAMGSSHQELADIVAEQAELSQPFQVNVYFYVFFFPTYGY